MWDIKVPEIRRGRHYPVEDQVGADLGKLVVIGVVPVPVEIIRRAPSGIGCAGEKYEQGGDRKAQGCVLHKS